MDQLQIFLHDALISTSHVERCALIVKYYTIKADSSLNFFINLESIDEGTYFG